ncbi:hypothetical protein Q7421_08165 [Glaesserella parasuis]|nr:hypothetical protein [Glaesserella parasuis]
MTYENEGIEVYTIVESEIYTKLVADILTQEEQEELATFIASEPECGDVIPCFRWLSKITLASSRYGKTGRLSSNLL